MNNVASTTILVTANPDLDDCLTGAAEAYTAEFPELEGYDLSPRWEVDSIGRTSSSRYPSGTRGKRTKSERTSPGGVVKHERHFAGPSNAGLRARIRKAAAGAQPACADQIERTLRALGSTVALTASGRATLELVIADYRDTASDGRDLRRLLRGASPITGGIRSIRLLRYGPGLQYWGIEWRASRRTSAASLVARSGSGGSIRMVRGLGNSIYAPHASCRVGVRRDPLHRYAPR